MEFKDNSITINSTNNVTVANNLTVSGGLTVTQDALFNGQVNFANNINTGTLYAGAFVYHTSDERLKKNIKPIDHALDKVEALNGVSFNWKKDGKKSIGVIAQNVEKVFPELVNTDKKGMKSVAYSNLVGVLIEAIKEQQKEIESLNKKVALLELKK